MQVTRASDSGFNPRVNLSYEPSHDLNLYTTISKGFRPGGANQILPPALCQAGVLAFGPDEAWNYEVGEKAKLLDNRLTINGDVYYIRWLGVQQVITLPCGYQYYNNAGDGRAFGPELEINARLTDGLDRVGRPARTPTRRSPRPMPRSRPTCRRSLPHRTASRGRARSPAAATCRS